MKFGNYIPTGSNKHKKKRYGFLGFFGVGAETESLTSSPKERSTDSFFSYLLARFLGFFSFMRIKLSKKVKPVRRTISSGSFRIMEGELSITGEQLGEWYRNEYLPKNPDETTPIGILKEDGTIIQTDYQLKNIHEFVTAFYQPNTHVQQ